MKIYEYDGKKNMCGERLQQIRREKKISQENLSQMLQLEGVIIDRFSISRIESGARFVADYELYTLAKILEVPLEDFFAKK